MPSVQKNFLHAVISSYLRILLLTRTANNNALCNSSLGIEGDRKGAFLDFPMINEQLIALSV